MSIKAAEVHTLTEAQTAKVEALEKKFASASQEIAKLANKLHAPLYQERSEIVKDIKGFWLQTMLNLGSVAPFLSDEDHSALEHLIDIESTEDPSDLRGLTLTFTFSENPYFTNKTLVKKFVPKPDSPEYVEFDLEEHSTHERCSIDWKSDDKNLSKLKPTSGSVDEDDFEPGSFFSTFFETDAPMAASIAETIAEELYPNALSIYTGDYEADFDDGFEDMDEDEDDEDDE